MAFKREKAFEAIPFCWGQGARMKAEEVLCFANLHTISLVGCGLKGSDCQIFSKALEDENIFPVVTQQDKIRLSFAVEKEKASAAIEALHKTLVSRVKFSS
jgi:aspartokinase